jgi:hypothetical protein
LRLARRESLDPRKLHGSRNVGFGMSWPGS